MPIAAAIGALTTAHSTARGTVTRRTFVDFAGNRHFADDLRLFDWLFVHAADAGPRHEPRRARNREASPRRWGDFFDVVSSGANAGPDRTVILENDCFFSRRRPAEALAKHGAAAR